MAYLQRVTFALLVALFASTAHASFVAPVVTQWKVVNTSVWYPTAQAACNAISGAGTVDGPTCWASNGFSYTLTASNSQTCPANSTGAASACTCDAGYQESGQSCVVIPVPQKCIDAKGGADLFTGFASRPTVGTAFCPSDGAASGCGSKITGGFGYRKDGAMTWTYEVEYSGVACTPPTSGTPGTEATCKGTVGTVNGVTVCSPPSDRNTIEAVKSTTATAPVGPASAPGSGGSTTTEEATSCTGSKCSTTTTTTTTPAGGGAATVVVKTEDVPKDDYCRDNPRAIMCLTSSFGGACAGGFTCEGDAVQCATAREIHIRNCRMFDQDSPESLLYGTEKNKAGSQVANENVAISSANFDTSDAIGGSAACITDKVVTVMGSPITIPFSGVCVHLAMLGDVLLTVSFLLAGRIFMRG